MKTGVLWAHHLGCPLAVAVAVAVALCLSLIVFATLAVLVASMGCPGYPVVIVVVVVGAEMEAVVCPRSATDFHVQFGFVASLFSVATGLIEFGCFGPPYIPAAILESADPQVVLDVLPVAVVAVAEWTATESWAADAHV